MSEPSAGEAAYATSSLSVVRLAAARLSLKSEEYEEDVERRREKGRHDMNSGDLMSVPR